MSKWNQHRETRMSRALLPYQTNGCVPVALARILADDPSDEGEVGQLAELAHEALPKCSGRFGGGGMDATGCFWGGPEKALEAVGISWLTYERCPASVVGTRRGYWGEPEEWYANMTCASFFRKYPGIVRAYVRTNGHVGYYAHGVGYGLGARHRVIEVWVLEYEGELADFQEAIRSDRVGLSVEDWRRHYKGEQVRPSQLDEYEQAVQDLRAW